MIAGDRRHPAARRQRRVLPGILVRHRPDGPEGAGDDHGHPGGGLDTDPLSSAISDDPSGCWVTNAQVAEETCTAFTSNLPRGQAHGIQRQQDLIDPVLPSR